MQIAAGGLQLLQLPLLLLLLLLLDGKRSTGDS